MRETLKECEECHKFYDFKNINFCLNVAISEKLNEKITEEEEEHLKKLDEAMKETTGIKWCICDSKKKKTYLKQAEEYLKMDEKDIAEEELGFDFKLNEDVFYEKNQNNFDDALFLRFIKSLKLKLKDKEIFNFNYLNFDKLTSRDFKAKEFYLTPNYLLIYDFENLQEDNIDLIIKINNIIKERKSNNKKTFIVSSIKLEKLEKFLITRFYTKDEHIVLELFNLLKNNFSHKIITTVNKNNNLKLNTVLKKEKGVRKRQNKTKETEDTTEQEELFY